MKRFPTKVKWAECHKEKTVFVGMKLQLDPRLVQEVLDEMRLSYENSC